jgi:uncharacterized protein YbcV (DUF1398 family)
MTKAAPTFTIEQIHEIHDRLGTIERFPDYLRALSEIGVEKYDSYLSDGHSEYFAGDGRSVVSAAVHEVLPINDASDREKVIEHLGLHELGRTSYLEMSKGLATAGWRSGRSIRMRCGLPTSTSRGASCSPRCSCRRRVSTQRRRNSRVNDFLVGWAGAGGAPGTSKLS